MRHFFARRLPFVALVLLGLGAGTTLTGCFDKEDEDEGPDGSVCNTAATVVAQSNALALRLGNGTVLMPTGKRWDNFHAKAGDKLLIGYSTKKGHDDDDGDSCHGSNKGTKLGCISLAPAEGNTTSPSTGH